MFEFRRFLESSEAVIAYHGTRNQFDRLEPRPARYGTGISFTKSKEIAGMYGEGQFKGGKRDGSVRIIKAEITGNLFDFTAPINKSKLANGVRTFLERYKDDFTPEKYQMILRQMIGSSDGESFWRGLLRSFSKRGTDRECQIAKSKNIDRSSCESVIESRYMPDVINDVLRSVGYSGITYMDTNAGITHRCYLVFDTDNVNELDSRLA